MRVESAFLLGRIFEIEIPVPGNLNGIRVVTEMEVGEVVVRRDRGNAIFGTNGRIE